MTRNHIPRLVHSRRSNDRRGSLPRNQHDATDLRRWRSDMADKSITKTELVASIASATGESQATVSRVLDSLFTTVSDAVAKGSKVSIPGWISFEQVDTAARTGRNPQTGAEI